MAKKIKRMGAGGMVETFGNPELQSGMQGGLSGFGTSSPVMIFKKGGVPKTKIENQDLEFDEDMYAGITDDIDHDGLPNADDPEPQKPGNKKSIEQMQFTDTFKKLLDTKKDLDKELQVFVKKLQKEAPGNSKIFARTKTPFSILNKLVSTRLINEKHGLKDLVGTTVAFPTYKELQKFQKRVSAGWLGKVVDFDDFYAHPNHGYRAYHYIIEHDGVPIELQLKTDRMKEINILSHDAYKNKRLNADYMLHLTTIADNADKGDQDAIDEFNKLMTNKHEVEQKLNS
jgi:ppGpp synthetase/RelA/SpoT-type nucleotidyltranferase